MRAVGLRTAKLLYRLRHGSSSYLASQGWFQSAHLGRPVDKGGAPLPWLSYPFIDFVQPRLRRQMIVVEFGSGYSTIFWAHHVMEVFAVEHDRRWFEEIGPLLPSNARVRFASLDPEAPNAYVHAADEFAGRTDLVLIDGPERHLTILHAPRLVSDAGVVVLDNADRREYVDGCHWLVREQGFRRIDFVGMGPIATRKCDTAIFYRDGNCLGI